MGAKCREGGVQSQYFMAAEFYSGKMRKSWRRRVVMVAQQRKWASCP